MKLNFAMFCQEAGILPDGRLQIVDPLISLFADKKPAIHNGVVVVNFKPEDSESHTLEVAVRAPYAKGGATPYKATVGPSSVETGDIGHLIHIEELILEAEGEYNIDIMIDGKKVASLPFSFTVIPCGCCPNPQEQ